MKPKDQKRHNFDCFIKLLPYINRLLEKVKLTDEMKEYSFDKASLLMRFNKRYDSIEISLANERPIFPTLVYTRPSVGEVKLLYYRINYDDYMRTLYEATGGWGLD